MNKVGYIIAASLICISGIGFVGWGSSLPNSNIYSIVLLTLGAALIGSGVSQLIATYIGVDIINSLISTLKSHFTSDEMKLRSFRSTFHHYHLTEMNHQYVWRYSKMDFQNSTTLGQLNTRVHYIGKDGKKTYYHVEGAFRDERLIFFIKAEGRDEPTFIAIFPFMGKDIQKHHCGLVVLESWDETHLVSRAVLTQTPVNKWTMYGTVNQETAEELDKIWAENIHLNCLPFQSGIN